MPLTGAFIADFDSFTAACDKAEVSLKGFESGSNKVESSLNKMSESFSGTKIIQEATLMAEVFQRAGNGATLTGAELARMGTVGSEAVAKLRALGQDVPAGIQQIADATRRVVPAMEEFGVVTVRGAEGTKGWSSQLSQFDSVLGALGIHIGPEVRGLTELGEAGGKSAGSLGLVATAGLALGAGVAGWKIGRAISDFFDLDESIGNATAKLLGFGDVAAQRAGAGMDVLARASTLAGHAITDFATAQQIIIDANGKFAASMNTAEFRVSQWRAEIAKVEGEGKLESLRRAIVSHNSTMEELSTQYGISGRALEFFKRSVTESTAAYEKDTAAAWAAAEKLSGAIIRLNQLGGGWKTTLAAIDPVAKAEIQNLLALGASASDLAIKYGLSEIAIKAVSQGMAEQTAIMGLTEPKLGSLGEFVKDNTAAVTDWYEAWVFGGTAIDAMGPKIDAAIPKVKALAMTYWEAIDAQAAAEGVIAVGLRPGETKNPDGSVNYPGAKSGGGGGSASFQMGPMDFTAGGGWEAAMKDYTAAQGGSSLGGFGGARADDFTAWALAHGKAKMMAMGGPTTEGPAYLHNDEYVVPKGGALVRGGGGGVNVAITINGSVLGNKDEIARVVGDALMTRFRASGGRLPSGA